ncbi:hypothetical protein [Microbulbifer rhizosphaerae]|uniref:Uncharacterized protein n=1 Tax=Microbulbifer rhizosphaerae TaxID=1562603 RepID=A0A7W4Z970_9GAMM|nr:hypothetical protein [Microbulbifer rhizosphaerae]MBB3061286.1 hypothetical protein [Microbulbifer rhizosphaerae]
MDRHSTISCSVSSSVESRQLTLGSVARVRHSSLIPAVPGLPLDELELLLEDELDEDEDELDEDEEELDEEELDEEELDEEELDEEELDEDELEEDELEEDELEEDELDEPVSEEPPPPQAASSRDAVRANGAGNNFIEGSLVEQIKNIL